MRFKLFGILLICCLGFTNSSSAKTIWASPDGRDHARGTKNDPTNLESAWNSSNTKKTTILLKPGNYSSSSPSYWENKSNVLIRSASKRAILPAVNIFHVQNIRFQEINFTGDIHCERCQGFELVYVQAHLDDAWEVVKINQSSKIIITNSSFSGAGDNVLDMVAVRYAKIKNNRFRDSGDWCAYAKGGSYKITVSHNIFENCGVGGFTAGQGTGFQFMTSPYIRYEAYNVLVSRNTFRNIQGAAFGVNGGYKIRFLHNIAENVGQRSHTIEVGFGQRSCDGVPGADRLRLKCNRFLRAGGWGTVKQDSQPGGIINIPNKFIYVIGNVISSPDNTYDGNQQILSVRGKIDFQPGSNVPRGSAGDKNLVFKRNIIWVSPRNLNLGLDDACLSSNKTCNKIQLKRDNLFNKRKPAVKTFRNFLVLSGWAKNYIQ